MQKTPFRSVYASGEPHKGLSFADSPSLTKQSFKDDADVNRLVGKYLRTGVWHDGQPGQRRPMYEDFSDVSDYRDIVDRVVEAQGMFAELSAEDRLAFDNDPLAWLDTILSAEPEEAVEESVSDSETTAEVEQSDQSST